MMKDWGITWGDVAVSLTRMQGRQMTTVGGKSDPAFGALLYIVTVRRASWRSQRPPKTVDIIQHFQEWNPNRVPNLGPRLGQIAQEWRFRGVVEMVEVLAK